MIAIVRREKPTNWDGVRGSKERSSFLEGNWGKVLEKKN